MPTPPRPDPHHEPPAGGPPAGPIPDVVPPLSGQSDREVVVAGPGDPLGGRLRDIAADLEGRDRAMGRIARQLVAVSGADGLHDRLGGMTLQVWLEHVCRIPATDARALLGAIDVLTRMPTLLAGLCDGWLSWLQVTAICRAGRKVRVGLLADLDTFIGDAMVGTARFEPDALVQDVWQWVDTHQPSRLERDHAAADRGEWAALQPRLTGGGTMHAELGATGWAIVAEGLSPVSPPAAPHTADLGLDGLDGLDGDTIDGLYATLDDRSRAHTRDHGAEMAARLIDLCAASLAGTGPDLDGAAGPARPARPLVLATIDIDALLDQSRTPGWLLHTLAGGRMKVTATALQRLVDQRGADLRGIVLDDAGAVVGVGRRTRVPPGWLRQAIWARDLIVTDPDRACPIRKADLDHIVAWPDGATDVTNLHPVGRRWHNLKTSKAWTVTRQPDGTTTWRHRRHGWTLRMVPPRRHLDRSPDDTAPFADSPGAPTVAREAGSDPPMTHSGPPPDAAVRSPAQPRLAGVP